MGTWEIAVRDRTLTLCASAAELLGWRDVAAIRLEQGARLIHPDDLSTVQRAVAQCLSSGAATCACRLRDSDGRYRQIALHASVTSGDGLPTHVTGTAIDITGAGAPAPPRSAAGTELVARAFDSASTGMSICEPTTMAYLHVNDAMCALLGRTREELLDLSVSDLTHPDDLGRDLEAVQAMLGGQRADYHADKRYIRPDGTVVWASVHVAPMYDADGSVAALLAQKIDITERRERETRLGQYARDAAWLGRIRDAIADDRLILYWQPIVDLRTGETVQRELLLRMRDEDGTIVAPGAFLPVAERYGLVTEIDRWVLREAVAIAAQGTAVEFNLSAASISDVEIRRELAEQLTLTGADPSLLVIEITETAMLDQPEAAGELAQRLRRLGCALALDDFGTGFATLSYLKHLPAAHLKIDMEFVANVAHDETDRRLVRGIVGLAREFGLTTIAEGIEDEQTLLTLRELGVDRGQGYLFARPSPVEPKRLTAAPRAETRRCPDCVDRVRALFTAFDERDVAGALALCHPQLLLRPLVTSPHREGAGEYRGHAGLLRYLDDVQGRWQDLRLTPTAFWEADNAVIVFGYVAARDHAGPRNVDALWVFRVREDLVVSIHAFDPPNLGLAPVTSQPLAA